MIDVKMNKIPKKVVVHEKFFGFQDGFKRETNIKKNISSMQFEVINHVTIKYPKTINLGSCCFEAI